MAWSFSRAVALHSTKPIFWQIRKLLSEDENAHWNSIKRICTYMLCPGKRKRCWKASSC